MTNTAASHQGGSRSSALHFLHLIICKSRLKNQSLLISVHSKTFDCWRIFYKGIKCYTGNNDTWWKHDTHETGPSLRELHQWMCWLAATELCPDTCSTAALARCWHWTWTGCCTLGLSMEKFPPCEGMTPCIILSVCSGEEEHMKQRCCDVITDLWTSVYVLRESLSRHTESFRHAIDFMLIFCVWISYNQNRKGLESQTICKI